MKNTPQQLQSNELHKPVLLEAVLKMLSPKKGESYLDLTAGYGGHAKEVMRLIGSADLATLVDRDPNAQKYLKDLENQGARVIQSDFLAAAARLHHEDKKFDMVLLDLGVSSPQLDNAERGFSIMREGPLDMRMDQSSELTAEKVVNAYAQDQLTKLLREYGEEPKADKIAQAVVRARPLSTTWQLADIIKQVYRGRNSKINPATRTFQAIRIEVNDELGQLEKVLPIILEILNPGGRVAVISFHSLEDRIVKLFFREEENAGYEARLKQLTKQPILGATEDVNNPRSRSAKLRVAVKIKNKEGDPNANYG